MNREPMLLGYYNYTVILTYIGAITGLMGIVDALEGNCSGAVVCLMIAGFCDMFDGTIASTRQRTRRERCFGIQIDSLSDLICFGVLPAVIVYQLNHHSQLVLGICALYVLCALIRLAYFNVDEQERQQNSTGPREIYYGLPVTLSALFVPLIFGACQMTSRRPGPALAAALATMGMLFLMPVPLRKPKLIGKLCVLLCGAAEIMLVVLALGDA